MINIKLDSRIQDIADQIVENYKPEEIILFGSTVRGTAGKDSDVDLLVVKENVPSIGIERRWQLRKLVKKDKIPVDFLVLKRSELRKRLKLGDPFIENIINKGKVLYKQDE